MKVLTRLLLIPVLFLASACQRQGTVCPEDSITYFHNQAPLLAASSAPDSSTTTPKSVEIRGRTTTVDRVIQGPICADTWRGTIYVACDIEIAAWDEAPLFFERCPLTIEPETTIYVAAHNDTAYYKGCSCHTGELAEP